jgi:hypothetical protein
LERQPRVGDRETSARSARPAAVALACVFAALLGSPSAVQGPVSPAAWRRVEPEVADDVPRLDRLRPRAALLRRRPPVPARPPSERGRRQRPDGHLRLLRGWSPPGAGRVYRFAILIERHVATEPAGFAAEVERILFAPRGWTRGGRVGFRRVARPPYDFRVILASRGTTDRLCAPALTMGRFSCHNDGLVVLNEWRWRTGASSYANLTRYRAYLVNHEVGHALGHGHRDCAGGPAPVMMPQTKGVDGCAPNPWPLEYERALT